MIRTGIVGLATLMSLMVSGTPPQKIIVADIIPQRLEKAKVWEATNLINFRESPDLQKAFVEYY
jgi:threonine dehydrogenase-like Zn-dependent dehydrogenase